MSFEELGLMLRQERERRGLSVEEVADRLKLMPRIIRAIEQADAEELPQAAYARGFVKAYGSLLELEAGQLQAGMEDAWPDDHYQPSLPYEAAEEKRRGGKGRFAALISLLLILAAGGGFWFARDLDLRLPSQVLSKAEPAKPATSEVPSPPARAAEGPPAAKQSAPRQTRPLPEPALSPIVPTPAPPAVPADNRPPEKIAGPAPSTAPAPAAQQEGRRNLIITALAECWVHSNADNTDTRQFSLRKGDTFALTFSKKLVLKLGNAGGVRLRLDGQDLEAPGEAGQVRTLTFPTSP